MSTLLTEPFSHRRNCPRCCELRAMRSGAQPPSANVACGHCTVPEPSNGAAIFRRFHSGVPRYSPSRLQPLDHLRRAHGPRIRATGLRPASSTS